MAPPKDFNIAIIGGSIAGLTLAIALHERNVPVQIYERAKHFREIGAGVAFSANAIDAMNVCHGGVQGAFNRVATHNEWPSKRNVWFDYYDGMARGMDQSKSLFSVTTNGGRNGLHRADFLNELVKLFPAERAHFGKHLEDITEEGDGKLLMWFGDGTTAEADAVIGCDGVHSRVRRILVGPDHPAAEPTYTHKYAYRGVVPMEEAIKAVGEEKARNGSFYLGEGGHVLTFPISGGERMNIVAFYTDPNDWEDTEKLTKWSKREEALKDFKDFGHDVTKILELTEPELNMWAIFDLGNSLPSFYKGRIAVTGDAGHATSPHHGSGAGFAIEDGAVMAEVLADEHVRAPQDIEVAFAAFDAIRRERDQWLVKSSRFLGDAYDGMVPEIRTEWEKIHHEIVQRHDKILSIDISKECERAKEDLHRRLA